MNRIGEGLFLIGLGSAVFFGWWSGLFSTLIEDATGRVRGAAVPAGNPTVTPLAPGEAAALLDAFERRSSGSNARFQ